MKNKCIALLSVLLLLQSFVVSAAEKSSGAVGSAVVGGVVALVGAKACQWFAGSDAAKSATSDDDIVTRVTALETTQGKNSADIIALSDFIDRDALGIDTSGAASASSSSSAKAISLGDLLRELNGRVASLESGAASSSSASSVEQDELIKKSKKENDALRRVIVDLRVEQDSLGKTVLKQSEFIAKQGAELAQLRVLLERISDEVSSSVAASSSQLADTDEEEKSDDDTE